MVQYYCSAVHPKGMCFGSQVASYPTITKSHNTTKAGLPRQLVLPRQRHVTDVSRIHISISVNGLLIAVCVLVREGEGENIWSPCE